MLMHANRDALDSATRFKFRLFLSQAPGLHICNSKVFRCLGPFAPAFFDQRAINRVGRREEVCCDAIRRQRRRRKDGWRGLTASSDWKNFWVDGRNPELQRTGDVAPTLGDKGTKSFRRTNNV
jgi:hypothetical protein